MLAKQCKIIYMQPTLASVLHVAFKLCDSLYHLSGLVSDRMSLNTTLLLPVAQGMLPLQSKVFLSGSTEEDKHVGSHFSICLSLLPPSATGRKSDSFSSICTGTPADQRPVFVL